MLGLGLPQYPTNGWVDRIAGAQIWPIRPPQLHGDFGYCNPKTCQNNPNSADFMILLLGLAKGYDNLG